jgi:hypothetical protein
LRRLLVLFASGDFTSVGEGSSSGVGVGSVGVGDVGVGDVGFGGVSAG